MTRFVPAPLRHLRPFRVPGLRVRCLNADGVLSVELTRTRSGKKHTHMAGLRGRFTLDEASALLQRPRREVELQIRAGFLRARRLSGRRCVTLQACIEFLLEEQYDVAMADGTPRGRLIPWEEVEREFKARRNDPDERREPEPERMPSLAEQAVIRDMLRPLARSMPGATFGELLATAASRRARRHLRAERAKRKTGAVTATVSSNP